MNTYITVSIIQFHNQNFSCEDGRIKKTCIAIIIIFKESLNINVTVHNIICNYCLSTISG